jgi:hypothetical protein
MHLEYFELFFFVVVGWVSPARARGCVSLYSFALSLLLRVCICFSRRAIETRIYPNSRAQLTFSLTHNTHVYTHTGKFKYGKYKHKKSASLLKCQNCEKSTVKLRYRKLCLSCAQESGRCPQCSKSQKEQELEDRAKRDVANNGEEREEEEEEEEETTDDEAYEEEGIVITRR